MTPQKSPMFVSLHSYSRRHRQQQCHPPRETARSFLAKKTASYGLLAHAKDSPQKIPMEVNSLPFVILGETSSDVATSPTTEPQHSPRTAPRIHSLLCIVILGETGSDGALSCLKVLAVQPHHFGTACGPKPPPQHTATHGNTLQPTETPHTFSVQPHTFSVHVGHVSQRKHATPPHRERTRDGGTGSNVCVCVCVCIAVAVGIGVYIYEYIYIYIYI